MATLTRRGALTVTTDLDKIAGTVQNHHAVLGIPEEYALRFAFYCDVMSDTIEKHAIRMSADEGKDESEDDEAAKKEAAAKSEEDEEKPEAEEVKKEAKSKSKKSEEEPEAPKAAKGKKSEEEAPEEEPKKATKRKRAVDETGASVEPAPGNQGFDANDIGDAKPGPLAILPPAEAFMGGHFTQDQFQQLREKQEGGQIGFKVSASLARLRRLAAEGSLSAMEDVLKVLHAKLSASEMSEVKALAGDVKKQIDAVGKVRDLQLAQQAVGMVEPEVVSACDRIYQAVSEQVPYLQQVVSGVDGGSPVALLEFQKMVGGGSLKDLVALGAKIVVDAAKAAGPAKKDDAKEAKAAGEVPEAFKKNWDKGDKKDDKDEDSKKEAAAESEDDDKDEEAPKKEASAPCAYDLFSN